MKISISTIVSYIKNLFKGVQPAKEVPQLPAPGTWQDKVIEPHLLKKRKRIKKVFLFTEKETSAVLRAVASSETTLGPIYFVIFSGEPAYLRNLAGGRLRSSYFSTPENNSRLFIGATDAQELMVAVKYLKTLKLELEHACPCVQDYLNESVL